MNPSRIATKPCRNCGDDFRLPMCRINRDHFCSSECGKAYREKCREARRTNCLVCGASFIPRTTQLRDNRGKYCGVRCRGIGFKYYPRSFEWRRKVGLAQKGRKGKAGSDSPRWMGGREASYRRRLKDGRIAQSIKRYRADNPDKVREWDQKRRGLKTGRLPKGTVANLLRLQRYRCAVCKDRLNRNYHVDHIIPLAKGGKHEPSNVQLLCPTCNVRKSAKDPIRFMREMGYLL